MIKQVQNVRNKSREYERKEKTHQVLEKRSRFRAESKAGLNTTPGDTDGALRCTDFEALRDRLLQCHANKYGETTFPKLSQSGTRDGGISVNSSLHCTDQTHHERNKKHNTIQAKLMECIWCNCLWERDHFPENSSESAAEAGVFGFKKNAPLMMRPSSFVKFAVIFLILMVRQVSATWWFVSQMTSVGPASTSQHVLCENIPDLVRRQRRMCKRHPEIMAALSDGTRFGIRECQQQFENSTWNCPVNPRDSTVFGRDFLQGTKEWAFIHAINSAGVMYSIIRACSRGSVPRCKCDLSRQGTHKDPKGTFTWGGCSDNLHFGGSFARRFIDAAEKKVRDGYALVNLHNNGVGRKSVRKRTRLQCKCHGVSGSCTSKTCWRALASFREASRWLKNRFESSKFVIARPDGGGLVARKDRTEALNKDLVYLRKSPDYCLPDRKSGYPGTAHRRCVAGTNGLNSCDRLCCGRGHVTRKTTVRSQCGCKFQWCCAVSCNQCEVEEHQNYCNP